MGTCCVPKPQSLFVKKPSMGRFFVKQCETFLLKKPSIGTCFAPPLKKKNMFCPKSPAWAHFFVQKPEQFLSKNPNLSQVVGSNLGQVVCVATRQLRVPIFSIRESDRQPFGNTDWENPKPYDNVLFWCSWGSWKTIGKP